MGIHIKGLNMCKRTKHKYHSTQAQRREAHNQAKQGPNERRIRLNPNQIALSLPGTHMDPLKRSKGDHSLKMGPKGPSGGVAAPPMALFRPKLHRPPLTAFPWSVQVGMLANLMRRRFVPSISGDLGNIPRNTPLLSTYKRRTSPPHSQQHLMARTTPQEYHSKGLRP